MNILDLANGRRGFLNPTGKKKMLSLNFHSSGGIENIHT